MKRTLSIVMILLFVFPMVSFADNSSRDSNKSTLPPTIDAFSADKENQKLEELGYLTEDGLLKIDNDKPIVINFEDGSSIEYFVQPKNRLNNKYATVTKAYNYGVARVLVDITVWVTISGRTVTITDAISGTRGSFFIENSLVRILFVNQDITVNMR